MRREKQNILITFKSVLAAFIGVQSRKQHEEDFARGSVVSYIVVAIVFVLIFIAVVITVVNLVMASAN